MSEVILFRPRTVNTATYRCPLGLVYIATPLVNNGIKVKIIDEEVCPDWNAVLEKELDSSAICVGISVMTGRAIKSALDFSNAVKRIKDIPVVWGGIHPSFLPAETLKNEFVDIVVIGEGENKFSEIVYCLKNNSNLEKINGIAFKRSEEIVHTKAGEDSVNLNNLPLPVYSQIDIDYYSKYKRDFMQYKTKVIDLNSDRGCPYRCGFCYNIKFNSRQWRSMSSPKLLNTIEELIDKYGVDAINFVSDNFFVDKNRVYEVCKGIIDRGFNIAWHADIRIDTFLRYEDDLIALIKKSGCSSLSFGVETGSDRMLKIIHKDITANEVFKAHKKARDSGFIVKYHFMIGFPDETRKDIIETMKMIRILTQDQNVFIYGPSIYVPYPGTPLYDRCLQLGFFPPNRLEGWINYGWDNVSKLPWLTKNFKNYINEVKNICEYSNFNNIGKVSLAYLIYKKYYRARFIGLICGIRLFTMDSYIIQAVKNILIRIYNFCIDIFRHKNCEKNMSAS